MDIKSLLNEQPDYTTFSILKKPKKTYTCSHYDCVKSFKRKSDLIRHKRIHTGERPYQCNWKNCQKTFIQRSALTVHLRTHTGERPHICEHENCQKSFGDSSSLARHRKTHTGNRPYSCDFCSKSFTRKTTLIRHKEHVHRNHRLFTQKTPTLSPISVFSDITDEVPHCKPFHDECPATPPTNFTMYTETVEKPTYLPPMYVFPSYTIRNQVPLSYHSY